MIPFNAASSNFEGNQVSGPQPPGCGAEHTCLLDPSHQTLLQAEQMGHPDLPGVVG